MSGDAKAPGGAPAISSFRLLGTMGGAGAVAGLIIVVVYQLTLPAILANRASKLEEAILQVVPGSVKYQSLYLVGDALTAAVPAGVDAKTLPQIYAASGADGAVKGYAIPTSQSGFADTVDVLFGLDPARPGTLGLVIVNSRETPGLGDKVDQPQWRQQFDDAQAPIVGVKAGQAQSPQDVEMITGATITSRTVITAVNKGVERWKPIIDAYRAGAQP